MADEYPGVEKMGLLGPTIKNSLQLIHARELAKQMLTGGVPGMKHGGTVHATGIYKLHKGETVTPARKRNAKIRLSKKNA